MRTIPDYYAIIQVAPQADKEVIEAAYRRLAAKYHPDVNRSPGATERMKLLNAAYEVLSDPEKRRAYDLRRRISPHEQPGSPPQAAPGIDLGQWLTTAAMTIVMLAITEGGSRFGPRGLLLVGLLALGVWLAMASRKG